MQERVYAIWCVDEAAWVLTDWMNWVDAVPTECPNDSEHEIDADKTAIEENRPVTYFYKPGNPSASDDASQGYETKDEWYNTNTNELFVCLDAATGLWAREAGHSVLPLLGRMSPTVDGEIQVLGWNVKTNDAASLTSASPVTLGEDAGHSHIVVDMSAASGLPFTIRITGTSIDEATGDTTPSDTQDLAVTADGSYQTSKSWVGAPQASIVEEEKSCTVDLYRNTYWDRGNTDFTLTSTRLEWTPDADTWSIQLKVHHVHDDGSLHEIDDITYTQASSPPRAGNGKPGKYKRGDYAKFIHGGNSEGLIVAVNQTNIASLYLDMGYSA